MGIKEKMRSILYRVCAKSLRTIEDRIFYAIFQLTRVTNDHYGWRPKEKK